MGIIGLAMCISTVVNDIKLNKSLVDNIEVDNALPNREQFK